MNPFGRRGDSHALAVAMTSVGMGNRLLTVGTGHPDRLAAIAGRVGLSGGAVAAVPDEEAAVQLRAAAARAGVLLDIEVTAVTDLPFEPGSFDLVVVDDTTGALGGRQPGERKAAVREIARVLRPGGRLVLIGATPRRGIGALVSRDNPERLFVASGQGAALLRADGFSAVRAVGEREGLAFVEGIKRRDAE